MVVFLALVVGEVEGGRILERLCSFAAKTVPVWLWGNKR